MFNHPLTKNNGNIKEEYRYYRSLCVKEHCFFGRARFDELLRRLNKTFDTRFMCCGASPCKISTLPLQYLTYKDSDNYPETYGDIDYNEDFDNTEDFDYTELFDDNSNTEFYSDFAEEFQSNSTEKFYNISDDDDARVFEGDLNIDKDPIDLANDFAKHFDSRSAVDVQSTFVHTRMSERSNQGNDMFNTSNIIPASPCLAALVFLLVLLYLVK